MCVCVFLFNYLFFLSENRLTDRENRGRDDNECASNYSSNTSLTNASSSTYLLPSFATKRRIPGTFVLHFTNLLKQLLTFDLCANCDYLHLPLEL